MLRTEALNQFVHVLAGLLVHRIYVGPHAPMYMGVRVTMEEARSMLCKARIDVSHWIGGDSTR